MVMLRFNKIFLILILLLGVLNGQELVEIQGDLDGYTTEGGEYSLFRDKQNNNVRLELYFYGEMGNKEQFIVFNKQGESLVKEKSCEYNMPIYMKDNNADSFDEECKEVKYKLKKSNTHLNKIIQFVLKKNEKPRI